MSKITFSLPLAVLLVLGSALGAQDTGTDTKPAPTAQDGTTPTTPAQTTPAQTTPEEQPAQSGAADNQGNSGTGGNDAEIPSYIKSTHDDWQIKCFPLGEGKPELCQMYQLLKEAAGNPVAEFTLYRLPDDAKVAAGVTIAVPLGTLLTEGIKLSVDGAEAKVFPYAFCNMAGCYSRLGLPKEEVDALMKGKTAQLTIVPAQAPDQTVKIDISLKGFTAAYNEATVLEK